MKIDQLLAQYLYQQKQLELPGIGTFTLDAAVAIPDEADKQKTPVTGISFKDKAAPTVDENLVDYVRSHTNKIRPLAQADIESYVSLSKQLLNIGNPLYIEGIGTLLKQKDGSLQFTPGLYVMPRMDDITTAKDITTGEVKGSVFDKDYGRRYETSSGNLKQWLIIGIVLVTIGLIAWGAYYLYTSNAKKETESEATPVQSESNNAGNNNAAYAPDSSMMVKPDNATAANTGAPAGYKYIIEITTNRARAFKRLSELKSFGQKVQLSSNADSTVFKLYFDITSLPADTTRVKDSLSRFFSRKVVIE